MSGWVTFSWKQETERQIPVLFLPELYRKWTMMADNVRQESHQQKERSVSIGFYCGLLDGQSAADYPPLTDGFSAYQPAPYDNRFAITGNVFDPVFSATQKDTGLPGEYSIKNVNSSVRITIRGSYPLLPPFLMARQCLYFRFSPYLLNE